MKCTIYKSIRKLDHYLFVAAEENFSGVPKQLLDMLGRLEQVMELELDSKSKLARADVTIVMQNLDNSGYYLQLPPAD